MVKRRRTHPPFPLHLRACAHACARSRLISQWDLAIPEHHHTPWGAQTAPRFAPRRNHPPVHYIPLRIKRDLLSEAMAASLPLPAAASALARRGSRLAPPPRAHTDRLQTRPSGTLGRLVLRRFILIKYFTIPRYNTLRQHFAFLHT